MEFDKHILVLKQVSDGFSLKNKAVSGILRIEIDNDVCTFYLSLVNLSMSNGGEYVFYLIDDKNKIYSFPLGVRPITFTQILPSIFGFCNGFSAGLVYQKDDIPLTVAFSKSQNCQITFCEFKSLIASNLLRLHEQNTTQNNLLDTSKPEEQTVEQFSTQTALEFKQKAYDDEAVATENYFDFSNGTNTDAENVMQVEQVHLKNDHDKKESEEDGYVQFQNGVFDFTDTEEKGEKQEKPIFFENEAEFGFGKEDKDDVYDQDNPYYLTARKELNELFDKFPAYNNLLTYFPESTFVKVHYSAKAYYVVGIIKEDKKEKYICYGVPSAYSENPPKELDGFCTFIPLSIFDMKGDGIWMMFQDAVTGDCIKKQ